MAVSPLRRRSDRIEKTGRRICVVVVVLGMPLAVTLAWAAHHAAADDAEHYAATLHRAEATTLAAAPSADSPYPAPPPTVAARWTGPDGSRHRGTVQVPEGTDAGRRVPIWTTSSGELAAAPPTSGRLIAEAIMLAVKLMLGVAVAAIGAFFLLRRLLDRHRYREWDREWAEFAAQQDQH